MIILVPDDLAKLDRDDGEPPETVRVAALDLAQVVGYTTADAAVVDFDGYRGFEVVFIDKPASQQGYFVGGSHRVLSLYFLIKIGLFIDLVADDGFIVTKSGDVAADMNRQRLFRLFPVGVDGLLDHGQRDKDVLLGFREVPSDADAEHVGILAVHGSYSVDVLLRHAGAVSVVNVDGAILGPVLVESIVKEALQLCGVPAHQEPCSLCG